jgi:hypothetical protein
MSDLRYRLAEAIWTASRADEGTISATGANHVADALLPLLAEVRTEAYRVEREAAVLYGDPDDWCRGTGMNRTYWRRRVPVATESKGD